MKRTLVSLWLIVLSSISGVASADVPTSLIVVRGDVEWAWASPVAPDGSFSGTGVLTMHDSWHVASSSEFSTSFTGLADLYSAFGGGSVCASSFFDSGFSHCDGVNVDPEAGIIAVWHAPTTGGWAGNSAFADYAETFVARGVSAVPEPETYAMLLAGLGLLGFAARRRKISLAA